MQYHNSYGRIILNAEAAEVCAKCEGEGKIAAAMNGGPVICDACSWAPWPDLKFDDSSPEWDGILTYPTRRFLRFALASAGGLKTIKSARMGTTTFPQSYEQLRSSDRFCPKTQRNGQGLLTNHQSR